MTERRKIDLSRKNCEAMEKRNQHQVRGFRLAMARGSMWVKANGRGSDVHMSGSTKGVLEVGAMKVRPAQEADVLLQLPALQALRKGQENPHLRIALFKI